ncbi:hypothetical protein CH275_04435 [Rhodococcus sp. 06-235-1A]|uniref:hypothetical protein n=1 Tax=Rhodococcus sp. 06-235-1A TaxID=2022508 RepID=UPI000B9C022F|nr:hypothetical protein [Rhodococcus sp. 06-235-1A]OZD08685.1 hypothetical protein CH275_04435 [Rhodococcus sp. 06-235-1A]
MYQYEQILNEHRQRAARGVRNYERLRVAAERAANKVASTPNSAAREIDDDEALTVWEPAESELDLGAGASSLR